MLGLIRSRRNATGNPLPHLFQPLITHAQEIDVIIICYHIQGDKVQKYTSVAK